MESVRRIAATHATSTSERDGEGTCSKGASTPSRLMETTCWQPFGTCYGILCEPGSSAMRGTTSGLARHGSSARRPRTRWLSLQTCQVTSGIDVPSSLKTKTVSPCFGSTLEPDAHSEVMLLLTGWSNSQDGCSDRGSAARSPRIKYCVPGIPRNSDSPRQIPSSQVRAPAYSIG